MAHGATHKLQADRWQIRLFVSLVAFQVLAGGADGMSSASNTSSADSASSRASSAAAAAASAYFTTTTPLSSSSPPPHRSAGGGDIVFPEHDVSVTAHGRRPQRPLLPPLSLASPPCARAGATFCEHVDDYPTKRVAEALENAVLFEEFFGNDSLPQPVGDRIGGEMTLCPSQERLIFPKMGQNENDHWVFIVNLDGKYQQGIRVEQCQAEGAPCLLADSLPAGAAATCRQKYVFRKLLAVGESGGPQPDSFRMPSCCACFVDTAAAARAAFGATALRSHHQRLPENQRHAPEDS